MIQNYRLDKPVNQSMRSISYLAFKNGNAYILKQIKARYDPVQLRNNPELRSLIEVRGKSNIVRLQAAFHLQKSGQLILVFEKLEKSLKNFLKQRPFVDQKLNLAIIKQVFKGIQNLHQKGIIHRNICPQNVLINQEEIKLCGFGSSKNEFTPHPYTQEIGNKEYRAPQCMLTAGFYNKKIDIWSAAVLFYQLIYDRPLFKFQSGSQHLFEIMRQIGPLQSKLILNSTVNLDELRKPEHFGHLFELLQSEGSCYLQFFRSCLAINHYERSDYQKALNLLSKIE